MVGRSLMWSGLTHYMNVFLIIRSLLKTCRFRSLRRSLAGSEIILAIVNWLEYFFLFRIGYTIFKKKLFKI